MKVHDEHRGICIGCYCSLDPLPCFFYEFLYEFPFLRYVFFKIVLSSPSYLCFVTFFAICSTIPQKLDETFFSDHTVIYQENLKYSAIRC